MSVDVVGGALSGIGSIINAGTGIYNSIQGNKRAKEQFEYQKQLQREIFEREDSAVQRRAADMDKAGISKWLAAGDVASAGQVVGTNLEHKDVEFDLSGIMQLGQMLFNLEKQKAEVGNYNADTALKQQQVNTEIKKALELERLADLHSSQSHKNMKEIDRLDSLIRESEQNIVESQSRTDLNDVKYSELVYNLVLSQLLSIRTNQQYKGTPLQTLARILASKLGQAVSGNNSIIPPKGYRYRR